MYELYDKSGRFLCYRMTKRIKNDNGEYDVLTARSKKSEKDCRHFDFWYVTKRCVKAYGISLHQLRPDKLRHFPHHLFYFRNDRVDAVRMVHAYVFMPHLPAPCVVCAQSAHTHFHDVAVEVSHGDVASHEIAQQQVGVGCYFVRLVVESAP